MEVQLFQDIATIVTFVAPGYFAMQIYSLMHAKKEREFSRLFIESIVYSLPIVALSGVAWHAAFGQAPQSIEIGYVVLLISIAILAGVVAGWLRTRWPIQHLANRLNISTPNTDLIKSELRRIDTSKSHSSAVTIQLKSGAAFSGTVDRITRQIHDGRPMYFSFTNIAWYDEASDKWSERPGNIIVSRDEIEYIETGKLTES